MDPDTKHSRMAVALAVIVTTVVAALALVVATSSTDAKAGGGAGFSASRESVNCVAGVSEDVGGNGTASPADLEMLTRKTVELRFVCDSARRTEARLRSGLPR